MSNPMMTQEELQQIQEVRKQMLQVASALGELSYQETILNLEKEKFVENVKSLREKERNLLSEFGKKYGDGVINLETGEIQVKP